MANPKELALQQLLDEIATTAYGFDAIAPDVRGASEHARDWTAELERLRGLSVDELIAGHESVAELTDRVVHVREVAAHDMPGALQYSRQILTALGQLPGDPMTPPRPRKKPGRAVL